MKRTKKEKLEEIHEIYLPIYGYLFYIIETKDITKSRKLRDEQIGHSLNKEGGEPIGLHSYNPDKAESFIFIPPGCPINTLVHEIYHGTCQMFRHIGGEEIDEEVFAYHLSYILENAYKHLRDSKW